MVSRELQARAGLLQARAGHLGLGGRLVLVAYRVKKANRSIWPPGINRFIWNPEHVDPKETQESQKGSQTAGQNSHKL